MKQPTIFDDTNTLPLFCGVPQKVEAENFAPREEGKQLQLLQFKFEDARKVKNENKCKDF